MFFLLSPLDESGSWLVLILSSLNPHLIAIATDRIVIFPTIISLAPLNRLTIGLVHLVK
jgi:hypothetical protein